MIQSIIYQKPISLLVQYAFTIDWVDAGATESRPLSAVVTVSKTPEAITILDIALEDEVPETFSDHWSPTEAIEAIKSGLKSELERLAFG